MNRVLRFSVGIQGGLFLPFRATDVNLSGQCSFVSVAFVLRGFDWTSLFLAASKHVAVGD